VEYDWPLKAAKFARYDVGFKGARGHDFKDILLFLGQDKTSRIAGLGTEAKICLDALGVKTEFLEYNGAPTALGYPKGVVYGIFAFNHDKIGGQREVCLYIEKTPASEPIINH
jgi:hypothetical protein